MEADRLNPEAAEMTRGIVEYVLASKRGDARPEHVARSMEEHEWCRELSHSLDNLKNLAAANRPDAALSQPTELEVSDSITALYENDLSSKQAANLIFQLQHFPNSADYLGVILEDAFGPLQDEILIRESELQLPSLADKVLAAAPAIPGLATRLLLAVKKTLDRFEGLTRIPVRVAGPAFATVLLVVMAWGGHGGYRYYLTTYRIDRAEALMRQRFRIFFHDPQLSGDYRLRAISMLLGPEDSPYGESKALADEAIANGSSSPRAYQVLAHFFVAERAYERADSVLQIIPVAQRSTPILNDMGVVQYQKGNWSRAAEIFNTVISTDAGLRVAHFNLALSYQKLGRKRDALQQIDIYLGLEEDEAWRNAALQVKQELAE